MNEELKIPENTVIHCPTKELANKVLGILKRFGYRWSKGDSIISKTRFEHYKNNTCYNTNNNWKCITYCEIDFYEQENYKIIEATEFIKLHTMTPKEILLNAINECENPYNTSICQITIVETSLGNYIAVNDKILLNMNMGGFMKISSYDSNLNCDEWSINSIYKAYAGNPKGYKTADLIWERPQVKEVTLEEIAEKFGVSVDNIRIKD